MCIGIIYSLARALFWIEVAHEPNHEGVANRMVLEVLFDLTVRVGFKLKSDYEAVEMNAVWKSIAQHPSHNALPLLKPFSSVSEAAIN